MVTTDVARLWAVHNAGRGDDVGAHIATRPEIEPAWWGRGSWHSFRDVRVVGLILKDS